MASSLSTNAAVILLTAGALLTTACSTTTDSNTPTFQPANTTTPATLTPTPTSTSTSTITDTTLTPALVTRVVDGDTIDVQIEGEEFRVRYIGIDTPETVDPRRPVGCFGVEAAERNKELLEGKTVELEKDISETDQFGRLLRYVWLAGEMVNATLVAEGYATASTYPPDVKYSDRFIELQREARDAGRGLWGPACNSPTPIPAAGECEYSGTSGHVIKGNISQSTGEKIYHVPGGEFYEATIVDEAAGERWFCTEADALDAGWRKSLR